MKMTREEYLARREAIREEWANRFNTDRSFSEYHAFVAKHTADLNALYFEYIDSMELGDRANVKLHTDVNPCTIIKRTAKTITVRYDKAELDPDWKPEFVVGGFCAHCTNNSEQRWNISEDPDGATEIFRRRKNGWYNTSDCRLTPGWSKHYDYNF